MSQPSTLREQFEQHCIIIDCGLRVVETTIKNLAAIVAADGTQSYNPYHVIYSRRKSYESVERKAKRKRLPKTIESYKKFTDIGGIRIVTLFIDDVYRILDDIKKQPNLVVVDVQDWIANPKENGYRSLHVLVQVIVYCNGAARTVTIEIQIRTIFMEPLWEIEHLINYELPTDDPAIIASFRHRANELYQFELKLVEMRDRAFAKSAEAGAEFVESIKTQAPSQKPSTN